MSPLTWPGQDCTGCCCGDVLEMAKFIDRIDWPPAFQEDESGQLGADFWPRFDQTTAFPISFALMPAIDRAS
jgi:hypothetical protein